MLKHKKVRLTAMYEKEFGGSVIHVEVMPDKRLRDPTLNEIKRIAVNQGFSGGRYKLIEKFNHKDGGSECFIRKQSISDSVLNSVGGALKSSLISKKRNKKRWQ
ncbi:hypothetical protein A3715_10270 [Oleiphilus sp. HI0009]|nr:hypothetical protein A3715_10270 [Oleiphilus sp. HI0009]